MSNFLKDIMEKVQDEAVLGVVIGDAPWGMKRGTELEYSDQPDTMRGVPAGALLSWEQAKPLLSYEYNTGYGSEECHPVYIWTDTYVIFVCCYDGSTWISRIPRDPRACTPVFQGGG